MAFSDDVFVEVKTYLRIDDTDSDAEILSLIEAAEAYIYNAIGQADTSDRLYGLAVKFLVAHWYENRGAVLVGSISKELEFSLKSILVQLACRVGEES